MVKFNNRVVLKLNYPYFQAVKNSALYISIHLHSDVHHAHHGHSHFHVH